ncbi:unnamed protein product [Chrysodeixis includens]|uniref:Uncharacterized protein n=1 Tax=Chrysodeixis includens TaxID=689277 RepID=A0A9N8PXG0_CHRIL|nr:unnamed protein product [Chrysodeixis includens]
MANRNWGFCDLSVSKNFTLEKLNFLDLARYNTVALNTHIEDVGDEPKKKKRKGEAKKDFVPPPIDIPENVVRRTRKLNILQRVTIEFSDSGIAHKLNQSLNLKKYDIVAVIPKTAQAFQYACASMDIDLISFQPESKFPFKITRKLYSMAVDRGIFFEIMYAPTLRDSTARKNIITASQTFHAVGKSRNIVFTSGAENHMQIRDVHDVINFGFALGISAYACLDGVRNNPRRLILKAEARRSGKHYMAITANESDTNDDTDNKTAVDYLLLLFYLQNLYYLLHFMHIY